MLGDHKFFRERCNVFVDDENSHQRISGVIHLIGFPLLVYLSKEKFDIVNRKFFPFPRKQGYGSILRVVRLLKNSCQIHANLFRTIGQR